MKRYGHYIQSFSYPETNQSTSLEPQISHSLPKSPWISIFKSVKHQGYKFHAINTMTYLIYLQSYPYLHPKQNNYILNAERKKIIFLLHQKAWRGQCRHNKLWDNTRGLMSLFLSLIMDYSGRCEEGYLRTVRS